MQRAALRAQEHQGAKARRADLGTSLANAVFWAFVAVAVALVAAPAALTPLGCRVMAVVSGSMEPDVHVGSAVIVRTVDPASIRPGDLITFHPMGMSTLETHRVVAAKHVLGDLWFRTKGDANATPDPNLAPAAGLVGKVVLIVPSLGRAMHLASTPTGRLLLLGPPALILAVQQLLVLLRSSGRTDRARGEPERLDGWS